MHQISKQQGILAAQDSASYYLFIYFSSFLIFFYLFIFFYLPTLRTNTLKCAVFFIKLVLLHLHLVHAAFLRSVISRKRLRGYSEHMCFRKDALNSSFIRRMRQITRRNDETCWHCNMILLNSTVKFSRSASVKLITWNMF